jgi:CubicO group peptidase (beta-lactamase class C family)
VADPIGGEVASGFERVRDAFERNFTDHGDVGAACSVYLDGEPVVDLWGGLADRDEARPWEHDTLALVFSSTKGVTAVCVHRLVERGEIDLDAPVAFYWPEFAARGKGDIPVRWILTHQAGLAAVEGDLTLEEVYAWQPRFFAREIAAPLDLDFHIGLPAEREKRVARLYPAPEPVDPQALALREQLMGPDTLLGRVLEGPSQLFSYGDMWNTRALREAEMPSSNGIGGARDLARMYAALVGEVDGVRLLAPKTVEDVTRIQVEGPDAVIQMPTRFGLGFMLPPTLGLACPPHSFGHPGAGGSLGFADPQRHLGFGYVMNQMQLGLTGDARATSLVEAVYTSLDA